MSRARTTREFTGSQRPSERWPDQYIPFRVRRGQFRDWAKFTKVAKNLYGLLCMLPGGTNRGWHGSLRKLQRLYAEEVGTSLRQDQIKCAVQELINSGFLRTEPYQRQLTSFITLDPKLGERQITSDGVPEPVGDVAEVHADHVQGCTQNASTSPIPVEGRSVETTTRPNAAGCLSSVRRSTTPEPEEVVEKFVHGPSGADNVDAVVDAVRACFENEIGVHTIRRLIDETSLENVSNQFAWFSHRDNRWALNGSVAAFVTYVRDQKGEPASLAARRRRRAREDQERRERESQGALASHQEERYQTALEALSEDDLEELKQQARTSVGAFYQGDDTPVFQGVLKSLVLDHADGSGVDLHGPAVRRGRDGSRKPSSPPHRSATVDRHHASADPDEHERRVPEQASRFRRQEQTAFHEPEHEAFKLALHVLGSVGGEAIGQDVLAQVSSLDASEGGAGIDGMLQAEVPRSAEPPANGHTLARPGEEGRAL